MFCIFFSRHGDRCFYRPFRIYRADSDRHVKLLGRWDDDGFAYILNSTAAVALFSPSLYPSVRPLAVRPNSNWQMIRIRMRRVATLAVYYHQTSLAPFSPSTTMAQQPSSIFFPFCCWTGINLSARKYVDVSRLVGGRDKRTLLLLPNRNWGTKRKRKIRRIELWKVTVGPAKRRIV